MPDSINRGILPSAGAQKSPADTLRDRDVTDQLLRLSTTGPGFSVSIDKFQAVAGAGFGVVVSFRWLAAVGLHSILVVRNFSLDQGSADQVEIFPATGLKAGCFLTVSDQDPRLATAGAYYWLKLIPKNAALATAWLGPVKSQPTGSSGGGGGGSGTVTSVGLSMPAEFAVSGSPVTSSGTFSVTKAVEAPNTVWAGPSSGGSAAPLFRGLVAADIPLIAESGVINLPADLAAKAPLASPALTGTPTAPTPVPSDNSVAIATTAFVDAAIAASGVPPSIANANQIFAGPVSGLAAAPAFRAAVVLDYPFHSEPLTDGMGNLIFVGGDLISVVGLPN